jgi:hypothetical protein
MKIRQTEPRDVPKLYEIYWRSPYEFGLPAFDSTELLESLVAVDENDEPYMMLSALKIADMFLLVDHERDTPASRAEALCGLFAEMKPRLIAMGISNATAYMGPKVPKGFDRRLKRLGGFIMDWRCIKFIHKGETVCHQQQQQ